VSPKSYFAVQSANFSCRSQLMRNSRPNLELGALWYSSIQHNFQCWTRQLVSRNERYVTWQGGCVVKFWLICALSSPKCKIWNAKSHFFLNRSTVSIFRMIRWDETRRSHILHQRRIHWTVNITWIVAAFKAVECRSGRSITGCGR